MISNSIARLTAAILLILVQFSAFAQTYTLTPINGTFTPIVSGTNVPAIQVHHNEGAVSSPINIGFNFNFGGNTFTQVEASTSYGLKFLGWEGLCENAPRIAPLQHELSGVGGFANYKTTGTAPNRVFTFEWLYWRWGYYATAAGLSFQVKLHETTNRIEMVYRQEAGAINLQNSDGNSFSARIYIYPGDDVGYMLSDGGINPTLYIVSEETPMPTINVTSKPATGQTYQFNLVIKPEPTNHVTNFTVANKPDSIALSWADAIGTTIPDGYLIVVSNTNSFIEPVDGVNTVDDIDLSDGFGMVKVSHSVQFYENWANIIGSTTYYVRIYPYSNRGAVIDYKTTAPIPQIEKYILKPQPVNHVSNFSIDINGGNYLLTWNENNTGADGYLLIASTTNTFPTIINGTEFVTDSDLSDGIGAVKVPIGTTSYSSWTNINTFLPYYFKIIPYSNSGTEIIYNQTLPIPQVQLLPKPTQHATNFTATSALCNIILNWSDAATNPAPDGYLIIASSSTITAPVDGIDIIEDKNLSDGLGAIKIAKSQQTFSEWVGMVSGTTYQFALYPYTNSGTNILYKTDGTVPNASSSITVLPEPIKHATNFTVGNIGTISLNWEDAYRAPGNQINNALNFDGLNDYVDLGSMAPSGNFTSGFSYMGWIKWSSFNSWSRLFDFGTGQGVNNILIASNGTTNTLTFANYIGTVPYQFNSTSTVPVDKWVHISATISNTGVGKLYINGVLSGSMSNMQIPANIARNKCYLGRSNWAADAYFNGSMDEVSIWSKELTATEINTYMSIPPAGNETGLYACYDFNRGIAGGNNTGITTLPDGTANAKNGTLTNFTLTAASSNWVSSLQEPTGYLIQACRFSFSDIPYDSNPVTQDNDLSDGCATIYVDYGTKNYSGFTGIEGSNTYFFKIWPFTNFGNYIDYKTDGTIPSASLSYLKPAPITQVTNFSVSENNRNIELNWTDASPVSLGNAIALDGTNDYIAVPALGTNLNEFTIETWINSNAFSTGLNGVFNTDSWVDGSIHYQFDNGHLKLTINGGSECLPSFVFQPNQWYHTALTYSTVSGKAIFYVNGEVIQSFNLGVLKAVNLTASRIGGWAGDSRYFNGKMDEYRIWDKVRTQTEIAANMYNELSVSETGLLVYYKFNQGNAYNNNSGITTITDNSSNNKNGTLVNSDLFGSTSNWVRFVADAPDGYCIIASQSSSITAPVNGTMPQLDLDLSDGTGFISIPQGLQTLSAWRNSEVFDKWYFHIYPYNNSGSNILYNNHLPIVLDSISTPHYLFYKDKNFPPTANMKESMALWGDYDNNGFLDFLNTGIVDDWGTMQTKLFKNNGDKTFTFQTSFGNLQGTIAWADYDNDNDLDFVVSGSNGSTLETKIYRNNGSSFSAQSIPIIGVEKGALDWGDYNNDGFNDLIITGLDNTGNLVLKIYTNNGNNTFSELTHPTIEGIANGVVKWGDYDNDGFLDFILTGGQFYPTQGNKTKIYKNNGNNTFTEQTTIILPTLINSYATWGDYDNDGDLDLLLGGIIESSVVNFSAVYRNDGNNTFTKQTAIELKKSDRYNAFEWVDYDNDGYLDIFQFVDIMEVWDDNWENIIVQPESNTQIYRNNKDGSFSRILTDTTAYIGGNMSFGDFDNDYDLDMLVTSKADDVLVTHLYINNDRSQNTPPTTPTGLKATQKADKVYFTWNRSTDNTTPKNVISYNIRIGSSSGGSNIISAQALANGTLLLPSKGNVGIDTVFSMPLPLGTYYWSVQAIDNSYTPSNFATEQIITRIELPASNLSAEIRSANSLLLRWDNGSYGNRVVFCKHANTGIASPANNEYYTADPYYGNGEQIATTGWYCIFNGRADSTMVYGLNPNYGYMFHVIEYREVSSSPVYSTQSAFGNPGLFGVAKFMEQPSSITGITKNLSHATTSWVDVNNDGYLDLYMAGAGEKDPDSGYDFNESLLYINNGDNTFSPQTIFNYVDIYTKITNAIWGDYNNDGYKDALVSYSWLNTSIYPHETEYFIKVYKNVNGNNFEEQNITNLSPVELDNAKWADYNNDGYLDIIITGKDTIIGDNNGYYTKLFKNNSGSSFSEVAIELPVGNAIEWGDLNNDGDLDLVISGNYTTKIYLNEGNTFTEQTQIELAQLNRSYVNLADFNKDGFIDILLFGQSIEGSSVVKLYRNNGDISFTEESTGIISPLFDGTVVLGDYDNDGYIDILASGYKSYFDWLEFETPYSKLYKNTSYNNNNEISFEEVNQTGLIGSGISASAFGDYNNDGDLDYVITGKNGQVVYTKLYTNNTIMRAGSFEPNNTAIAPTNLKKEPLRGGVLISWDGVSTDETPITTMSYNIRVGTSKDSLNLYAPHFVNSVGFKKRTVPQMGNTGLNDFYKIFNLPDLDDGKYYYWQVQAVDGGYKGGQWSRIDSLQIKPVQAFFTADTVCLGNATQFTDNSVAYDGIVAWQWNFGDNSSFNTDQNPQHVYQNSGEFLVRLVATNNSGKTDTIFNTVKVKPIPNVTFNVSDVCSGLAATIIVTPPTNGLVVETWLWNFGDNQTSNYGSPDSHIYPSIGNYTITLNATANNGCTAVKSQNVVITTTPNTNLTLEYGSNSFCLGDSVIYSVPYNENYSYAWQRDGEVVHRTNTIKIKSVSANYKVIVTNNLSSMCWAESEVKTVTVNESPGIPAISYDEQSTTFCAGESITLSTNVVADSYTWLRGTTDYATGSNSLVATESGNYSLRVGKTYANNVNCYATSTDVVSVTRNPLPILSSFSHGETNVCRGTSVNFTASSISNPYFQWYRNNEAIENATSNSYSATQSGSYKIQLINTSNSCNIFSQPIDVVVNDTPDTPTIDPPTSTNFCEGNSILLKTSQSNVLTYQWLLGNNIIGTNSNQLVATESGNYRVKVENSALCSATSPAVALTRNPLPSISSFNYGETNVCSGTSVNFSVNSNSNPYFQWYRNNEAIENATSNSYSATQSGSYKIQLTNTNNICNIFSQTVQVTINELPSKPTISEATNNTHFCFGTKVELLVTNEVPELNYQWKRSGISINGATSPIYAGKLIAGDYNVEARAGGCANESDILTLTTKPAPAKPTLNARGPNVWILGCSNIAATDYRWFYNNQLIVGAKAHQYVANRNYGDYYVEINEGSECYSASNIVNIAAPSLNFAASYITNSEVAAYPNPTINSTYISFDKLQLEKIEVEILDALGKVFAKFEIENTNGFTVELADKPSGVYYCRIKYLDSVVVKKIVKL